MPSRFWLAALVGIVACAPSVPRPARQPPEPDAAFDLPAATTETTVDARGDLRAPPTPATDARAAATADARGDSTADTRGDAAPGDAPLRRDSANIADADADAEIGPSDGPTGVLPTVGDLVIDEILINPAGTDTNREWIEVANSSAYTLDLHLLHVADSANDVAVDAGLLAPGGLLVLGQSVDPTKNGGAPISFSFSNVISLNNAGDSISLCLGPCADGLLLSRVTWTADPGAAYDGHAANVLDPGAGSDPDAGADLFCPADQPFGTAGSFGTPGAPNPPCGD
jgi:hypothetical protein